MKAEEWIKVEDRLPERYSDENRIYNWTLNVLVYSTKWDDINGEPNVQIAFYNYLKKVWVDLTDNILDDVTHWMPIVVPFES
jgi:hypothetical protein